jgi:disease resistance protein RPS2
LNFLQLSSSQPAQPKEFTVAQFPILQMQNDIASTINLDLVNCSADMGKMKLCAYMKTKKFFLVLDDMWGALYLKELGVEFGKNKGSKLVFTTRNRDLIQEMNAKQFMEIQPLQREEAWELFLKVAFEDGHVPEGIENIARQVAEECKGLPLAIKVIGSTMMGNTVVDEWKLALKQMQKVDLNFPVTHPRINRELYQRLRWSYDSLPDANLKNCFLYCAMLSEDAAILVEMMVQVWISEGLVKAKEDVDYDYVLKTGESYVKLLENRCLFQVKGGVITVHDVVHDMAIYIGENEENCVLRAGQSLQHFPDIPASDNCRRISVMGNDIKSLPRN